MRPSRAKSSTCMASRMAPSIKRSRSVGVTSPRSACSRKIAQTRCSAVSTVSTVITAPTSAPGIPPGMPSRVRGFGPHQGPPYCPSTGQPPRRPSRWTSDCTTRSQVASELTGPDPRRSPRPFSRASKASRCSASTTRIGERRVQKWPAPPMTITREDGARRGSAQRPSGPRCSRRRPSAGRGWAAEGARRAQRRGGPVVADRSCQVRGLPQGLFNPVQVLSWR
jgi:hypothetical protein